jgi:uncharacterized protein YbjT (DUF2867 family)
MRIFLTGATGYVGSAVLDALLRANHQVTALVRAPQAADGVASRGVAPILGDLKTVKSYRTAAEDFDAYVHTAADSTAKREEIDRRAIDTLLGAAVAHAAKINPTGIRCAAAHRNGSAKPGTASQLAGGTRAAGLAGGQSAVAGRIPARTKTRRLKTCLSPQRTQRKNRMWLAF